MSMPNEERLSAALDYLASTDEEVAQHKAAKTSQEYLMKKAKAIVLLASKQSSNPLKEAEYYASDEYEQSIATHHDTIVELETLLAKRKRAELTIDVWRSLNANRRQG